MWRTIGIVVAWSGLSAVILHATLASDSAVLLQGPVAPIALALVGLGLIRRARAQITP